MKKCLIGIILTILLASPLAAQTDEPLDVIKKDVNKVLNVLKDPTLQGESAVTEKKEALRSISNEMFHWPLLSKRVLAKSWDTLNPDQQKARHELRSVSANRYARRAAGKQSRFHALRILH